MKNLIVISAPSGSGKTTLCRALQAKDPTIQFSVSSTTREKRNGEVNGVDYRFISDAIFRSGIKQGEFAEWEQIHGDFYYGTPKTTLESAIDNEKLLLLELENWACVLL